MRSPITVAGETHSFFTTGPSSDRRSAGIPARLNAPRTLHKRAFALLRARCPRSSLRILHHADIRQVAIALGKIQSVTDDELVGDLEPEIVDRDFFLAPLNCVDRKKK